MQTITEIMIWEARATLYRDDILKIIARIRRREAKYPSGRWAQIMKLRNEVERIKISTIWPLYKEALEKSHEPYTENIR